MHFWKLLIALGLITTYLPVYKFRNNKYFYFFLVNSLIDPIYILLRYIFHLGTYNYVPFVFIVQAITLPVNDSKTKFVSAVALFIIVLNLGTNWLLELITCEVVLSVMIYNLVMDGNKKIKQERCIYVFQLLLLLYFLRNIVMVFYYYSYPSVLFNYYSVFLIALNIIPILIFYFGPSKTLSANFILKIFNKTYKAEKQNLTVIQFQKNEHLNSLTAAEFRVLSLLKEGYRNNEIAEKLFISKRTVYFHIQNIKSKLDIKSTARLIKYAVENGENIPNSKEPALFNSISS